MAESKTFTLKELATLTDSKLIGKPDHKIYDVADLNSATDKDASFLGNPRYESSMRTTKAGVVFVSPKINLIDGRNFLVTEDTYSAFQKTIETFRGGSLEKTGFTGIHPSAVVHETCKIGRDVTICPNAVIDKNTVIGDRTYVGVGCSIGPNCTIGEDCIFHPNVTIREHCKIGNRVIFQPGVVIGSCGYGYVQNKQGRHIKLNHLGIVVIEDDVEIGANTTIDRARFTTTRIGRGTKIDSLVEIGHNVNIGEDNIIVGLSGIGGSTTTGNHVIIAGQVGIDSHIKIPDGTILSARTGVSKSLTAGKYGGNPAMPLADYNRNSVYLRNIHKSVNTLKELEKRITE